MNDELQQQADRGHGATGDILTRLAHPYGESTLYVGDDGRIYAM